MGILNSTFSAVEMCINFIEHLSLGNTWKLYAYSLYFFFILVTDQE